MNTNDKLTKDKMTNYLFLIRDEIQDHTNNMILGDFNFIDHEKDKAKGLIPTDQLLSKVWLPFLANTDMLDSFQEQNPKRKVWSFIGSGSAGNSRIDRVYVNTVNANNCTNIQYTPTSFGSHKVVSFVKNMSNDKGKGYYKMNTIIISDRELVLETLCELDSLDRDDDIHR